MKKTVFTIIGALVALMACQRQETDTNSVIEEQTEYKTLTFNASIIAEEETKVAVATTGVVTWTTGDSFAIYNTDGTKFEATIQSGQGTPEGVFTCSTFSGTLDTSAPAVYPYAYAGAKGKVVIPQFIARDDKIPAVMASEVSMTGETVNVDFHHIMAVLDFTLQNVPAYARALKLFTEDSGVKLSGTFSVNGELNGVTADSGNDNQVVYFPYKTAYGAEATTKVYFAVPAGSYTTLKFAVLDGDEDAIENTTKNLNSTTRALAANSYRAMPAFNVRTAVGSARDKYVKVEGVKWAKGNLRAWKTQDGYPESGGGSGWQDGWNVYDEQWKSYYFCYNKTTTEGFNYPLNQKDGDDYIHWDNFGWGTIGANSRVDTYVVTSGTTSFSICGKVFEGAQGDVASKTQQTGDARFTDVGFSSEASLCGDIAFWASKGKCRMPNATEIGKLTTNNGGSSRAHSQAGYYIPVSGNKIYGILFTSSPSWDVVINDSSSSSKIEFTVADLESGLFLPKIGARGSNGSYSSTDIKNCNSWATYWAGTAGTSKDGSGQVQSPFHLNFGGSYIATSGHYWPIGGTGSTYACNNRVGSAVRPVYF